MKRKPSRNAYAIGKNHCSVFFFVCEGVEGFVAARRGGGRGGFGTAMKIKGFERKMEEMARSVGNG